jgi:hypothetical protein
MVNAKSTRFAAAIVAFLALAAIFSLTACLGGGGGGDGPVAAVSAGGGGGGGGGGGCLTGATAAITASVVASRTSGVAPLAVFFDATGTSAAATPRPFHDLEYSWTFGEPALGNWAKGRPNASRNVAKGPVAAHVFETPGVYTVSVVIKDGTNTVTNSCIEITVTNPDTVYSGLNTICIGATIDPTPGAGGCPAGADHAIQSNFRTAVNTYLATGKRLLFKAGDTFGGTTTTTISANGPWTLGAFPIGSTARIANTGTNVTVIAIGSGAGVFNTDARIMDLEIDGSLGTVLSPVTGAKVSSISAVGNFDQLTLLRLNIHDVFDGPFFYAGIGSPINVAGNNHVWDQLTIADSTIKTIGYNDPTDGNPFSFAAGTHGVFIFATRFAMLGNLIEDTVAGEHLARLEYLSKAVVSNNTLRIGPTAKETIAVRTTGQVDAGAAADAAVSYVRHVLPTPSPTQYVLVSDNDLTVHSAYGVRFGPANDTLPGAIQNVITERNFYRGAPAAAACGSAPLFIPSLCAQFAVVTQANGSTHRNEIVDMENFLRYTLVEVRGGAALGMHVGSNVNIYNNTGYSALNTAGSAHMTQLGIGTSNINIKNNLFYVPANVAFPANTISQCFHPGGCAAVTGLDRLANSTDASTTNQMKLTSPLFTATPPVGPTTDWKPTAGSYALGTGAAVPVFSDFFGNTRTTLDLGAVAP